MIYVLICPPRVFPILVLPPHNSNPRSQGPDSSPHLNLYLLLHPSAASCANPVFLFIMLISYKHPRTNIFQVLNSTPKKPLSVFFLYCPPLLFTSQATPQLHTLWVTLQQHQAGDSLTAVNLSALPNMTTHNHWESFHINTETGIYKHF